MQQTPAVVAGAAESMAAAVDTSLDSYFTPEFQVRMLSMFIRNERVLNGFVGHIRPQQFSTLYQGAYLRDVVAWIQHWHAENGGAVLPRYVFENWAAAWVDQAASNQEHHKTTWNWLAYQLYDAPLPEADFLKNEFFRWYAAVEEQILLLECKAHMEKGGSLSDVDMLERLRQIGQAEVRATEPAMTLGSGDTQELQRFLHAPARDTIPCGITALDEATNGGMARKELWSLAAPPNSGKTTSLCNLSSRFTERGNFVVYFSLEQSKEQLYEKHLCSISENDPQTLRDNPHAAEAWAQHIHSQGGLLAIQEFPTGTGTLADMKACVRNLESQFKRRVDVVVVDYADDMKHSANFDQLRHQLKQTYVDLRGWAFEDDLLCITATQVNREAADKEVFGIEAMSEAYLKAAVADGIICLCGTEQEATMGIMRWFLAKNRVGPRYATITMSVNFALARIEERQSAVSAVGAVPGTAAAHVVVHGGMSATQTIAPQEYSGLPVPQISVSPPTAAPGVVA